MLDVDYHHGNGTQDIFWERADVLFVSLHADPETEYPYFLGYADERGAGAGEGYNVNFPLPRGTAWEEYRAALDDALRRDRRVRAGRAGGVARGRHVRGRPHQRLQARPPPDYPLMGAAAGGTQAADACSCMEGGYAVEAIGTNVAGVLEGFLSRR